MVDIVDSTVTEKTTKAPDAAATEEANRLLGMVVEEVSLVDRAANQRVFLIVKRNEAMPSKVKKDDAAPNADGSTPPPADAAGGAPLSMQAQVKDQLLAALTSAAEKLVSVANMVKDATVSDQAVDPAVPDSVIGAIGEVAQMLSGVASQYAGNAAAGDAAGATGADQTKDQAGTPGNLGGITDNGGVQKAAALLEKAGRKMAKERLERFRKAIDILAGLLKELSIDNMRKGASLVNPNAPVTMTHAQAAELLSGVEALTKRTQDQATALATANAEIAKLSKRVPAPNSAQPENPPREVKPIAWPLDLNRPISPTTVAKSKSFAGTGR